MVIDEAAILIRLLVEVSHGWQAKVSEIVPKFCKVFLAQHLRFALIGTPSHCVTDSTRFVFSSPSRLMIIISRCSHSASVLVQGS